MNGHIVAQPVIDTTLGAVSIVNPSRPEKRIHYEWNQLYMVRFVGGKKRYYYQQDTTINNYFTRDEMWYFMKGERDARKGFKARGSLIGATLAGLAGGLTGTFWGPVAPYGYMALSGIPKVRIRHETVSNPADAVHDAYLLGYEHVARQKRKMRSLVGGSIGLAAGYGLYALLGRYYPERIGW